MGIMKPILIFVTAFLFVYALGRIGTQTRLRVVKRMHMFDDGPKLANARRAAFRPRANGRLNRALLKLTRTLAHAEIDVSAQDFLLRWGLITLAGAIITYFVSGARRPLMFVGFLLISGLTTYLYVKGRSGRRLIRFEEGLPDMLSITSNSLRTGYSFLQAVQVVCENMRGPVQEELSRVLSEISIGMPLEQALRSAGERMHSADFNLIITAILIQRQVGGNLAEVLDSISHTIRERIQLKREIKVLTTQGRMSGLIFMILPATIGFLIYLVSPSYISILFQSSMGYTILGVGLVGQVIGFLIIKRIVRIQA